jgi:sarcosine oxidase subunit delta
MREHWYHAQGCRNWIEVQRNTQTHEILGSVFAKPVAL